MELAAVCPVSDISVKAADFRRREIAKAVVLQAFERAVDRPIVELLAILRRTLDAPERAAHRVDFGTLIAEAVLHQYVDGAAEGIEAECRVIGHDGDRPDRGCRNQIPVDGVAERLVDAHTVLVNCQSLRCTGDRRRDKAAELDVRLKRVACGITEDDTRHVLLQRDSDVERVGPRDLPGTDRVDRGWHLIDINSHAGLRRWRGRIDKNPLHITRDSRCGTAAGWSGRWPGGRCRGSDDLDRRQDLAITRRRLALRTVDAGNET